MATYTNKNGTASADVLTYNMAGTYHAGAGNDTIKIDGGSGIVVYTDSGNNIVNVTGGSLHTVKVAVNDADSEKQNGVEKLAINGANQVDAYLGSGKDEILLRYSDGRKSNGALSQIHGGGWTDTFTVGNGAQRYQLYGDAGDDIFNISSGSNIVCWGGAANDTFNVTGGTGIKLRGGDSADTYNISVAGVDMQLGYGNDVVNVTAGDNQTIKANLGINTINLKAGSGHTITADIDQAASKKVGHDVGYGQDKVYITGTATKVKANLGEGKDEVEVSTGSGHKIYTEGWGDTITVSGTTANSTFSAGDGEDIINITGGSGNYFVAGSGNDVVKMTGGTAASINLGEGNDKLEISGGRVTDVTTSTGNNSINVSGTGVIDNLYLGPGHNTITVDGGKIILYARFGENNETTEGINLTVNGGQVDYLMYSDNPDNVILTGGTIQHIGTQKGNDLIRIEGGSIRSKTADAGEGDDTIYVYGGTENTIKGGAGNDSIIVATPLEVMSNNTIDAGEGDDWLMIAGRGNTIDCGAGNEMVYMLECKETTINLGEGRNEVAAMTKEVSLYKVNIVGGSGFDKIVLENYLEECTLNAGEGTAKNTITAGSASARTGKRNKLYGGGYDDTITCVNNDYVYIEGGNGFDTINCTKVNYGVVLGGELNDEFNLVDVTKSYVEGTPKEITAHSYNQTKLSGNCSQNIICGGAVIDIFTLDGNATKNMVMGGDGSDKFYLNSAGCKYNRLYGGKYEDSFEINDGSNNTIYGVEGKNKYYINGGKKNLYEGGKGQDAYYIYSTVQEYSLVRGNGYTDNYYVAYDAKVIIDVTTTDNSIDYINLINGPINSCEVKVDKNNNIIKINNIYIMGGSVNFTDGSYDMKEAGSHYFTSNDVKDLKYGKTKSYTDLSAELGALMTGMGDMNNCVAVEDIYAELNYAYDGISLRVATNVAACK